MIREPWQPTMHLRWFDDGELARLQQRWIQVTIEWRKYGGQERRCEGIEEEWRDVSIEKKL